MISLCPTNLLPFLVVTIRQSHEQRPRPVPDTRLLTAMAALVTTTTTTTEYTQNEENNNRKSTTTAKVASNHRIPFSIDKPLLKRCRYGCTSRWTTGTEDRGVMTASGYPRCEGVKFAWTENRSVATRHTGASAGMHAPFYLGEYTFLQSGLHPSTVGNTPFCSRGLSIFIRIFSMYVFLDYSQTLTPTDFVIT